MRVDSSDILKLLIDACPTSFDITDANKNQFNGVITMEDSFSPSSDIFNLEISCINRKVTVKEAPEQAKLPSFCPERHINIDKSFCLGLSKEVAVYDSVTASIWWECIHNYLKNQTVADRTRSWPPQDSLSHGDAAKYQIRAENVANKLGLAEEYRKAMFSSSSWLRNLVNEVSERDGVFHPADLDQVLSKVNQTTPKLGKRRKLLVRRVKKLLSCELLRREEENAFWLSFEGSDITCCQTMPGCPLKKASSVK